MSDADRLRAAADAVEERANRMLRRYPGEDLLLEGRATAALLRAEATMCEAYGFSAMLAEPRRAALTLAATILGPA